MNTLKLLALAALSIGIPSPSVVEMTPHMSFAPKEMTVVVGEVVVWKNAANVVHTVTTDASYCKREDAKQWVQIPAGATGFYSGEIKPGDEFRARFEVPGVYRYACVLHEDQMMRGAIVVQGAEVK